MMATPPYAQPLSYQQSQYNAAGYGFPPMYTQGGYGYPMGYGPPQCSSPPRDGRLSTGFSLIGCFQSKTYLNKDMQNTWNRSYSYAISFPILLYVE